MSGWQVVPKGLNLTMLEAALNHPELGKLQNGGAVAMSIYDDILGADPTPTVEMPPLPKPFMNLYSELTPVVRDAWADQLHAYARAALAQYGIED